MGWNYRVVREYYQCPVDDVERSLLKVAEVYYHDDNDDRPRAYTSGLKAPSVAEIDEKDPIASLRWALEKQLEGLAKPVLDARADFVAE